jgi:ArsR family transcriptional regulator, arsenate/arsenite/antimonite-responsive transcriptional repressor
LTDGFFDLHISIILEIQKQVKHEIDISSSIETRSMSSAKYAGMFAAIGTEARLNIVRLLLAAHPEGLPAGEVQAELGIPASTLSHHLEKLKNEELVTVERRGTFLVYRANADTLRELMNFLLDECCSRTKAVHPASLVQIGTEC